MKTINLKGNQYAPVDERIKAFHAKNPKCSIRTKTTINGNVVMVVAKVIPNTDNMEVYFTGSSYGQVGRDKAFEKLETVAVGRALAFAGYLADGKIASYEEMEKWEETKEYTPPELPKVEVNQDDIPF